MKALTIAVPVLIASAASLVFAGQDELLSEDFEKGGGALPAGWRAISGKWKIEEGRLVADSMSGEAIVTFGQEDWADYEVSADAAFLAVTDPTRWLSIIFRASADGAAPWSQFAVRQGAAKENGTEFAVRLQGGAWSVRMQERAPADCKIAEVHNLRLAVRGQRVEVFLDGKPLFESWFCVDRRSGCAGLGASGCVAAFDNIRVRRLAPAEPLAPAPTAARVECVAHRGFSAIAPENTLISILKGIEIGADACEFDVHLSRDGVAVLMHDEKVDRTTDGKGAVRDLTAEELGRLDAGSWKGPQYKGEPVPRLVDVLKAMKGKGAKAVIEIKAEGMAAQVMDAIKEAGMQEDEVAIISFKDKALYDIAKLGGRMPRGFLLGEKLKGTVSQQADYLVLRAKACRANVLDLNYRMLSPELIGELKRRGFPVWCWTVDEEPVMRALAEWGVDSITTNRPDVLIELRKKMAAGQ